jgi:hypothetical protein
MMNQGMPVNDVPDAAKEAGRQLAEHERMNPETLKIVSRELLAREMYVNVVNQYVREKLSASAGE